MGGRGHESIAADLATKLRSVTQHFVSVCVGARGAKLRTRNSRCPHAHLGAPSRRLASVQPGGAVSGSWQNAQSSYIVIHLSIHACLLKAKTESEKRLHIY